MNFSLFIKYLLLLSFVSIVLTSNASDGNMSNKAKYKEAEKHLAFDEFDNALKLYSDLFKDDRQNYNLAYKIGYCFLSGEGQQDIDASIDYLLLATEKIDKRYKSSFRENKAPIFTYYYLGVAYRLNHEFDKAIDAFKTYQELLTRKEKKTIRGMFIDREIQTCDDAKKTMDENYITIEKIIVDNLADPFVRCPILCEDVNRLIFTNGKYNIFPPDVNYDKEYSEGPLDGVYVADRTEDGSFKDPKNIVKNLAIGFPFIPVTATADGSELYLIVDKHDNGDIYMSKYENGEYQAAEKVKALNTRKWESHATITPDGQKIYFTSLRKGGEGGLDIWYSEKDEDGEWQKPINLGPEINTEFHEEMPYIIKNGNALYFSSEGHTNIGGFDMFYSNYDETNKKWTSPTNLGYPFSTAGNDMGYIIENALVFAFCPVNDNKRREGVEDCDCIKLRDDDAPMLASISGIVELDPDNNEVLMDTRIKLIDKETGEELTNVALDENGNYVIAEVTTGSYYVVAYYKDEDLMSISVDVPQNENWNITDINMIIPSSDLAVVDNIEIKALVIENVLFDFDVYTVKLEYNDNLDLLANYLNENPEAKIGITGHTDYYGTEYYNMDLSKNRAIAVQNYLNDKGVNNSQMEIKYEGEKQLITLPVKDDAIRHLNRRAIITIIKQGASPIDVTPIVVPEEFKLK